MIHEKYQIRMMFDFLRAFLESESPIDKETQSKIYLMHIVRESIAFLVWYALLPLLFDSLRHLSPFRRH